MTLQARPTTYNGIEMRSRMEARVAAVLDSLGYHWAYEPRAYASRAGQYLPDFVIAQPGRRNKVFLEVKGSIGEDEARELLQRMRATILPSEPDAMLWMIDGLGLDLGLWASAWGTRENWYWFSFMACPSHPERISPAGPSGGLIAIWCLECDPQQEVTVPVEEADPYMLRWPVKPS